MFGFPIRYIRVIVRQKEDNWKLHREFQGFSSLEIVFEVFRFADDVWVHHIFKAEHSNLLFGISINFRCNNLVGIQLYQQSEEP
ncbi:hypothetical protein D3C73_1537070 [compost metagenome]